MTLVRWLSTVRTLTTTFSAISDNNLATSNGNVEVTLVDTEGTELHASTNNGRITTDLPITITGTREEDRLAGTIGAGGSSLKIETSNGSITIR